MTMEVWNYLSNVWTINTVMHGTVNRRPVNPLFHYLCVSSGSMDQRKSNEHEKSENSSKFQDITRNHNDQMIEIRVQ